MADYRIKLTDTIDFNVNLDGAGVDTGISYSLPGEFADHATLTVGGLLTPSRSGFLVVEAKNAAGVVLRRFTVEVLETAAATFEQSIVEGSNTLDIEVSSAQSPVVNQTPEVAGVPADTSVQPPAQPTGLDINTDTSVFSWSPTANTDSYQYQFSLNASPNSSWSNTNSTQSAFTAANYEGNTMHAFVRSKNTGGFSSIASTSASIPLGTSFTVARYAIEEGINNHFLPFTEQDIKTIIACAQYSTWGMMPFDHYMDWIVHGKNLALDIIAKSAPNNTYFGVPAKLKGLSSTTTWTADTASKTWLLQFIGFCAGWGWKLKYPLLSDWNKLYTWPTWDYLHKATQAWWGGGFVSTSVVNNGQPEFEIGADDTPGYFPGRLRITSDIWAASQKVGSMHPWMQEMDANRFAIFGDRLDNNGSSTRDVIVRKEFPGGPSGFGNSINIYINEILGQNDTVMPAGDYQPVYLYAKGNTSWDLGAAGAYLTTPINVYGYHESTDYLTLRYNNSPILVTRIRNTAVSVNNYSPHPYLYVRMGFVPIGLANARYRQSIGQSTTFQVSEATKSSRELIAKHILALHASSSSFGLNNMSNWYGSYDDPDPNFIPEAPEATRRYTTIANLAFTGATYTPSTIPVTSGTATLYNQYGSLLGPHPYKSLLGVAIDTNEVQEASDYMINGFLGDQYSIIVSG